MFTWICPQCGAEVSPSYNDCPQCAERKAQTPAAPAAPAAQPQYAPPPPQYAPTPPQHAGGQPGVQYVYVKRGLPAWAVTLLVALGLVIVGGGLYYYVGNNRRPAVATGTEDPPVLETVKAGTGKAPAAAPSASKFIEVTGIRIFEESRKPMVRFMVINHSQADLPGVSGMILLKAPGKDDPIASIPLKLSSLGPYEGKDITAPLKTKLRAYEMPDWQFIKAETQLEAQ